eukprot:snap_masked-scaffold_31-processed-gene-2.40-mRNA-1 protein AED:0.04 eAED:0.04 QI:0/-1/0/1/-1/1/1/0/431
MTSRINRLSKQLLDPNQTSAGSQASVYGQVGTSSPEDIVVVAAKRTPIARAKKGGFKDTTPDDLLVAVFENVVKESGINPKEIDEVLVGNVQLPGAYALQARTAMLRANLPVAATASTVNRQCSSGLQAVASIASNIKSGYIDVGIGAGVEAMTLGGKPGDPTSVGPFNINATMANKSARDCLTPMGITSETVAARYGVSRAEQDEFAVLSHNNSLKAQSVGRFNDEIVPVKVTVEDKEGNEKEIVVSQDEGPRKGTTIEGLGKLRPVFKKDGSTTAGNASQVSDGAAAVLLMKRSKAKELGMDILGTFRGYKVVGVNPDEMGIGPAVAIPALLEDTNVGLNDVDVYEINEAFASQAVYCVRKLGIDISKVNPNGGAISLGHPLGMTGARMVATLLHELKKRKAEGTKANLGCVSACVGTGMGVAALFESA